MATKSAPIEKRVIVLSLSVCRFVFLSVFSRGYIENKATDFGELFVGVARRRGSILHRCRCDTLCSSGFTNDVIFQIMVPLCQHAASVAASKAKHRLLDGYVLSSTIVGAKTSESSAGVSK